MRVFVFCGCRITNSAVFCDTRSVGSLLCMTLKDFLGNGNDSLSIQMEKAVVSIFCSCFLQLEQEQNRSGCLNTWCGPNGERK